LPDEGVVVGDQHPDLAGQTAWVAEVAAHRRRSSAGSRAATAKPPSGLAWVVSRPRSIAARSRIPAIPSPAAWSVARGNNRARDGCWLVLVVVEVSCTCESAREILTAGAEGHTDSSLEKAGGRSNPGTRPWIPKVVQQEKATWLRAL
jgi:hypothetical protein